MHYGRYTQGLQQASFLWNSTNFRKWLLGPQRIIPDSKCKFPPLTNDAEAYDLVRFLKEFTIVNYAHLKSIVVFADGSNQNPRS